MVLAITFLENQGNERLTLRERQVFDSVNAKIPTRDIK